MPYVKYMYMYKVGSVEMWKDFLQINLICGRETDFPAFSC